MKLPKELTTVTPLSKYFAMILFIALPFIGFFMGMNYQSMLDLSGRQQADTSLTVIKPSPTPTPENKNEWKTYVNKDYGFSFKHPNLIELNNTGYAGGSTEKLIVDMYRNVQNIPGSPDYYKDSLLIDIFENKEGMSLATYAKTRQKNGYTVDQESSFIISGEKGIKQILKYGDGTDYFVKLPNGNKILTIIRKDAKINSFEKDFDQILSTFQFTD